MDAALARDLPGVLVRRPAVPAVICIIVGILLAFSLPVRPVIWTGVALITAIFAILIPEQPLIGSVLIAVAISSIGAGYGQADFYRYAPDDISAFSSAQPRMVQLEIRLDDSPQLIESVAGGRPLPPKQRVIAHAERIFTTGGWVHSSGKILVQLSRAHPLLDAGQVVRVLGLLERPEHATNPGEFDWADYYRQQRILTSIRVSRPENVQILSDGPASPINWMRRTARDLLAMGFTEKRAADQALLRALVLGDDDPLMRETQQQMQSIGAAYLLSISGMHFAIVVACAYAICRLLMRSPRFACMTCLVLVLLYGTVALPRLSAIRSVALCTAVLIGILNGRTVDKLQLLSIVAAALLLLHPVQLFDAGFQLGFPCVAGMILFTPALLRWFADFEADDEGVPLRPSYNSVRWRIWRMLLTWFAFSLVAWAVIFPTVAYHFAQVSLWVIPCGMVLFPFVLIALLGGCAKILLTLAWPSLASGWASAAGWPVIGMRHLAALLARLPASALPVSKPGIGVIVLYYIVISLALLPWRRRWLRRTSSGLAAAAACSLLAALSLGFSATPSGKSGDELAITFLDIGAGQCAILQLPHAAAAMIDAGSSTVSDVTRSCLGPFLSVIGDRTISAVLLSHSDYDHISAVSTALPALGIAAVYTSHYFANFASIDPPADALLHQLRDAGKSPHLIQHGDHLQLARGVTIDALWPPPDCSFNCNNTGLVLRLSYGGKKVLFPADIQADAMTELLKTPRELRADVLVAAHHGSSEVTTPAFVNAVNPQWIISSNGSPLSEKQKRFEEMIGGRPLYRTSNCGAITLHIRPNGTISIETFLPQRPRQ